MSDDQIHVISTSTIKVESTARISLTPWDLELLFLEYIQMGLLFLQPTPHQAAAVLAGTSTASLIDHLKASLERTLRFFPPLVGRLATTRCGDGAASRFFIDCSNRREGGALFIHAKVSSLSVADVLNSSSALDVPAIVHSLFPLTGVANHEGVSRPLLAVQVTELVDGLFVGCSMNHLVADGASFWHLVNSWAELSRGEIPISKLPFLDRDQVNHDLVGSDDMICIYDREHYISPHDNKPVMIQSPPSLKDRVFYLTKESVAKLKAKANQEMVESKGKISSLQATIAHVWRSIIRCRLATNSPSSRTTLEIPMGARERLNPPLPGEYFGNAVFPGVVTLEAGEMLENGLGWTAWQINRMVEFCSDSDKVKEFYRSWMKKPEFLRFGGRLASNHFVLFNSPRFNVYGNDFGWGKPVAVRSGRANSFDGRITICGGVEEGSIEIEACLLQETFCALAADAEFMEFVVTQKMLDP